MMIKFGHLFLELTESSREKLLKHYPPKFSEVFAKHISLEHGLLSENEAGYDSSSVFSYIDRFKGNLLLIHGTGDDNVHAQHSIQLVNKFVKEGKQIDTMFYPSRNHGIYGGNASFHLRKLMTKYFLEYLGN